MDIPANLREILESHTLKALQGFVAERNIPNYKSLTKKKLIDEMMKRKKDYANIRMSESAIKRVKLGHTIAEHHMFGGTSYKEMKNDPDFSVKDIVDTMLEPIDDPFEIVAGESRKHLKEFKAEEPQLRKIITKLVIGHKTYKGFLKAFRNHKDDRGYADFMNEYYENV